MELLEGSTYSARRAGCTCAWLRGFGVFDLEPEKWDERIIWRDPECPVRHDKRGRDNELRRTG